MVTLKRSTRVTKLRRAGSTVKSPVRKEPSEKKTKSKDGNVNNSSNLRSPWTIEDFELVGLLGHGKYGKVYSAKQKDQDLMVAIKIIDRALISKHKVGQQVFHEIVIQSNIRHPNIVPLFAHFHDSQCIYLALQMATHGSLYSYLKKQKHKRLYEYTAAKYTRQIASALQYLHQMSYVHRDLKPENILIDDHLNAKLSDFGFSSPILDTLTDYCGTDAYMSPEMMMLLPYNQAVDCWSLGILCYEMLVGRTPFSGKTPHIRYDKMVRGIINFPKIVPPESEDLIKGLLTVNPEHRMELSNVLKHTWILSNQKVELEIS